MRLEFDVWLDSNGNLHLTCDDPRLKTMINIQTRDGLQSTAVLRRAFHADVADRPRPPDHKENR